MVFYIKSGVKDKGFCILASIQKFDVIIPHDL